MEVRQVKTLTKKQIFFIVLASLVVSFVSAIIFGPFRFPGKIRIVKRVAPSLADVCSNCEVITVGVGQNNTKAKARAYVGIDRTSNLVKVIRYDYDDAQVTLLRGDD